MTSLLVCCWHGSGKRKDRWAKIGEAEGEGGRCSGAFVRDPEPHQVLIACDQSACLREILFLEGFQPVRSAISSMAASSRLRPRRSRMMWSNSARTIGETLIE